MNIFKRIKNALTTEQAKHFCKVSSDEEGWILFHEAEKLLGKFDYSDFAYEDNHGYFEEADGYTMFRYLLVSKSYLLGDTNCDRNRWEIVCSCYEKCVDLSIDETTPEYRAFEDNLYHNTLVQMGIIQPVQAAQNKAETA